MRNKTAWLLLFIIALIPSAFAQSPWPNRAVRVIVPFPPGGNTDVVARLLAPRLAEEYGQPFVVDNRGGAGGTVGAEAVARAAPDGHTLIVIASTYASSAALYNLPYDPVRDLAPVAFAAYFDLIVLTKTDERYRTLADLLAAARANPGKLNFGTINPGSTQHLSAELFKTTAGINVAVVPFKTTPEAFSALLAGEIDAVFESYATAKALIDGNRLRALATSGPKRSGYLPSVPTVQEAGVPGYDVTGWNAKKRLLELGTDAHAGSQEELRNRLNADIAKWAAVIRQAGVPQQ